MFLFGKFYFAKVRYWFPKTRTKAFIFFRYHSVRPNSFVGSLKMVVMKIEQFSYRKGTGKIAYVVSMS